MEVKVGIIGYGNLAKGVEEAVLKSKDLKLVEVFSRRDGLKTVHGKEIKNINQLSKYIGLIDVMILCGGSATDLPEQTHLIAKDFNVVDSFDTHAKIPEHFEKLNNVAMQSGKLGCISVGWDPGLFSIARLLFQSFLPSGETYTFWGKGVSQGHSDAIRRVSGVKRGVQYTIPIEAALNAVRELTNPKFTARDKHLRECYVVAEDGADKAKIEQEIKNMPNYFSDYNTIVHFISEEEFEKNHTKMPHGGLVLRSGETNDDEYKYLLELNIKLDNNPGFTGSVLAAYARAIAKMNKLGQKGAVTAFDIPLGMLSELDPADLRKNLL